jgi:hypothetical protein
VATTVSGIDPERLQRLLSGQERLTRFAWAAEALDRAGRNYQRDPWRWAYERTGVELWSKQREVLESVRDYPLTAVHSCHAVGKSMGAAVAVGWWLDTHLPGEAFVVTTAPTDKQVKAVLWREINRLHAKANLPGRTNLTEWFIGKEMVAFGRKPADQDPTAFQGIHAKYVLIVLDEACGIPKELWDAASTLVANEYSRILAIGNPDDPFSEFASVCAPSSPWNVIHISYEMTPNFTGESVPMIVRDSLISPRWVAERFEVWGEDSAISTSKIKGLFPVEGTNGTIPYSWAKACQLLEFPVPERGSAEDLALVREGGIDVGAGADRTIIRERVGMRAGREKQFVDADPMSTIGKLVQKINEWKLQRVKVDSIGVGWAIAGRLRELSAKHNPIGASRGETTHNAEVVPVNFGAGPTLGNEKKFLNIRAEVHWNVGREYSRLRLWDLGDLDDDTLAELTASKYEVMDSFGKIKIEKKEEIIKRLGQSPDRSDALLLAFYDMAHTITQHQPDASISLLPAAAQLGMQGVHGMRGVGAIGLTGYGAALGDVVGPMGNRW